MLSSRPRTAFAVQGKAVVVFVVLLFPLAMFRVIHFMCTVPAYLSPLCAMSSFLLFSRRIAHPNILNDKRPIVDHGHDLNISRLEFHMEGFRMLSQDRGYKDRRRPHRSGAIVARRYYREAPLILAGSLVFGIGSRRREAEVG